MRGLLVAAVCAMALAVPQAEASWGRTMGRAALKRAIGGHAARGELAAATASRNTATQIGKPRTADQVLRADRARDAATPAKALNRERLVQRYTSAAQAEKEAAGGIAAGSHMTSRVPRGRPLSAEGAQKKYGLPKAPDRVMTVRVPEDQPVRLNKAVGGRAGFGELTSPRALPPSAVLTVKPVHRAGANAAR